MKKNVIKDAVPIDQISISDGFVVIKQKNPTIQHIGYIVKNFKVPDAAKIAYVQIDLE